MVDKDQKTVRFYVASLLEKRLDFSSEYATWIAKYLHDLNPICSKLLEEKGKDSEWHVRLSVATHLELDKDSKKLDRCVNIMANWLTPEKQKLIKEAIHTTKEAGDLISLEELQKIIMAIMKQTNLDKAFSAHIKGITMKKWLGLIKSKDEKSVIFNQETFLAASQTIIDRHAQELKHCEVDIVAEA